MSLGINEALSLCHESALHHRFFLALYLTDLSSAFSIKFSTLTLVTLNGLGQFSFVSDVMRVAMSYTRQLNGFNSNVILYMDSAFLRMWGRF